MVKGFWVLVFLTRETVNIGVPTPLLSGFDLILLIMDKPDKDWDLLAAKFLLQGKNFKYFFFISFHFCKKKLFIKASRVKSVIYGILIHLNFI